MKRAILAAGLLASAFAIPAYALDVHILDGGEVRAILGTGPVDAQANIVVGIDEDAVTPTEVTILAEAGGEATVTAAADVVGWHVYTSDNVDFGAVVSVSVANDGEALLIVDLNDGWAPGVEAIAIRASALVRTADGLKVDDTEAGLKASLMGDAAAAAPMPEPAPTPAPAPTPTPTPTPTP